MINHTFGISFLPSRTVAYDNPRSEGVVSETDPIAGAVTGIIKGDGAGAFSAAAAGTDYVAPAGSGAALTGITGGQVANTPAGGIAATDVQAAINELDTEKAPLASPTFTGTVTLPVGLSGIAKMTAGVVSAAVAGTDYEAPLGYTAENAANKVTSISSSSTDVQYPSAKVAWGIDKIAKQILSTSIISGCEVTVNGVDNTKFDVAPGVVRVVDNYTDINNPVVTEYTYAGSTGNTVTNLATQDLTYVSLDATGTLYQSSTQIAGADIRTRAEVGVVTHPNKTTISSAGSRTLVPPIAIASSFADMAQAIGIVNVSGNLFSANGANLKINKSAGYSFGSSLNYSNSKQNPNRTTDSALSPVTFIYAWRDGAGSTKTYVSDTLQPGYYDDNTTGSTTHPNGVVNNNQWTIMPIRYYPASGSVEIDAGQAVYNSEAAAEAAISDPVQVLAQANGVLRAWLIVRGGATDLSNTSDAVFIEASKFGTAATGVGTGSSTTTLQQTYDNSTTPEILTDSTRGAVSFKRGSAADTDAVTEILNGAGSVTSSITGAGVGTFTGLSLGSGSVTMTGSLAATGARVTKGWFTDIESTNMPTVSGTPLSSTFSPIAGSSSIVTTGTLTGGATGAGFTVALGTSTVTGILTSANGGTGNGFTKFTGPTTAEKTFTLPDASATLLYSGGDAGTPSALVGTNISGTAAALSIGGNAATATTASNVTNATFTTALTVNTGAVTLTGNVSGSTLTLGAGASSVSGANTGDQDLSGYALKSGATFTGTIQTVVPAAGTESLILAASAGVNPATPTSGSLWWNGTNLYFYNGATNTDLLSVGAGANTALSNLASVAINAALIPGTAGALDFGSTTKPWADLWLAGTSGTPGTNQFKITGASTSGVRTITLPDASGTVVTTGNLTAITATGTIASGTWNGTAVDATHGGTAQTTWALGDIMYASAANTLAKLTGNVTTTRKFLRQTGDGANSAAPAWDTVTATDVGLSNVENTALSTWAGSANIVTTGTLTSGATGAGFTVALGTSTVTGILTSANGGTGNGFTKFTGPTTAEKTFTLPDASATLLYSGGDAGTPSALVGTNISGTAANLTAGITNALKSATTTVDVSAATAPTSGQVLTATSGTAATWQTPAGGGNKTIFLPALPTTTTTGDMTGDTFTLIMSDAATELAPSIWATPDDFTSLVSVTFLWNTAATTGNAYFQFQSRALNTNESMLSGGSTDSIAYTTYATSGTSYGLNKSDVTAMANGLTIAAGDLLSFYCVRDGANASDTINNTVRAVGYIITYA